MPASQEFVAQVARVLEGRVVCSVEAHPDDGVKLLLEAADGASDWVTFRADTFAGGPVLSFGWQVEGEDQTHERDDAAS